MLDADTAALKSIIHIIHHDNTPAVGRVRSNEKMGDTTRPMQFLGVARFDDPEARSQSLAEDATKKVFKRLVTFLQLDDENETRN
jgi:hypothetical protein